MGSALGLAAVRLLLAFCLAAAIAHAQLLENAKNVSRALALTPLQDDFALPSTVDPSIPPLLAKFKREIRNWIGDELKALPPRLDPDKLKDKWTGELKEAGLFGAVKADQNPFGRILDLGVSAVPGEPTMLRVVVSYDSFCAPDDSVLFFEHRPHAGWRLLINFDNTDFQHPGGDRALVYAGISPRDDRGQLYAFIVRTRSHCPASIGNWNSINYHALRPTVDPEAPKVVLTGKHGYREDGDLRVELTQDTATMDFPDMSMTASIGRIYVLKYAIGQDNSRRIEPIAVNAEGFVEEWLASPWTTSVQWSEAEGHSTLRDWHQRLGGGNPAGLKISAAFPFLQACSGDGALTQVSFPENVDGNGPKAGDVFFLVRVVGERQFRMVTIATESNAACGTAEAYVNRGDRVLPESMNRRKDRFVKFRR